jgi:membrane associated rhomboid family serine protease
MRCFDCDRDLRRLAAKSRFQSWICDSCRSVAALMPSLRDSVPRVAGLERDLQSAPLGDRKCPQCRLRMQTATVRGGYGVVEVDGCTSCRLAWFDRGELGSLEADAPGHPAMSPEQRSAWRIERLRQDAAADEGDSTAAMIGMVFGIPYPDPVREYKGRPILTWALCAIVTASTVIAFGGNFAEIVRRFGMVPEVVRAGRWTGLLTHFFLHADVFHLAGNVFFLFLFASRLEALIGWIRLLSMIAVATVAGGLVHTAFAPQSWTPLIGASGGISGVLAAHACLRPRAKVRMLLYYRVVAVPASAAFVFWIVLQLIGTGAQLSGASAVSALAHLGGAVAGFLLALVWKGLAREVEPACA